MSEIRYKISHLPEDGSPDDSSLMEISAPTPSGLETRSMELSVALSKPGMMLCLPGATVPGKTLSGHTSSSLGVTTLPSITPRSWAASTWDGSTIRVLGGYDASSSHTSTNQELDEGGPSWGSGTALWESLAKLSACSVGGVTMAGMGFGSDSNPRNGWRKLDGASWTALTGPTTSLGACACVATASKVYLFGGDNGSGPVDSLLEYDVQGDSWRSLTAYGTAFSMASACWDGGDNIYVIGGYNAGQLDTVRTYSISGDSWTTEDKIMGTDPGTATHGAACAHADGRVVLVGGSRAGSDSSAVTEWWNSYGGWATRMCSIPSALYGMAYCQSPSALIMTGGISSSSAVGHAFVLHLPRTLQIWR